MTGSESRRKRAVPDSIKTQFSIQAEADIWHNAAVHFSTRLSLSLAVAAASTLLVSCEQQETRNAAIRQTGQVEDAALDEISGLQQSARAANVYFVHNDDGEARVYALDSEGRDLGSFSIPEAVNRDWEDLTSVPGEDGPLLVIADSGDNFAQHSTVILYFILEPEPGQEGRYIGETALSHRLEVTYPDGPRDCESIAWDPASDRILFLSKRDKPSRLYSIDRVTALSEKEAVLEAIGTVHPFRPPTSRDYRQFGARDGAWVSQPTGMDISHDGRRAAVISYRSLYLFERQPEENWETAFQRKPLEFEGPASLKEEAVTFTGEGDSEILVTTEGMPAPVYRFRLID